MLLPPGLTGETVPRYTPYSRELHRHRLQIEAAFATRFSEIVYGIRFAEIAQPYPNQKLPGAQRLRRFRLAPLLRADYDQTPDSKRSTLVFEGHEGQLVVPNDVRRPEHTTSTLEMDTSFGLALVFDDTLMAMSDGYVPEPWEDAAEIMVRNMQGYAHRPGGKRLPRNDDGFYSGVDWRRTLLHGWSSIAEQTGARTLGLHSARQNLWAGKLGLKLADLQPPEGHPYLQVEYYQARGAAQMRPGYDAVAESLGFTQMLAGHWETAVPIGTAVPGANPTAA